MTILNIETSTDVCSAAITIGGVPTATRINREGSNHAKLLPIYVQQLLDELKVKGLQAEAVALSEGPGSYTGLRIGTSTAKGICYGLNIPLIPVDTLQVLCAAAASQIEEHDALLCPMIDARRMEVYCALYNCELTRQSEIEAKVVDAESFKGILATNVVYFFGNGTPKCKEVITSSNARFIDNILPDAKHIGILAEREAEAGRALDAKQMAYYTPFYLKEFQAAPSHVKGLK